MYKTAKCILYSLVITTFNLQAVSLNNNSDSGDSVVICDGDNFEKNESRSVNLYSQILLLNNFDFQNFNYAFVEQSNKSAWLAFGLSVLYPGLGQLYNGEYGKAFLMAGLGTLGLAAFYLGIASTDFDGRSDNDAAGTIALTGLIVGGGIYIWSLIDAPVSANNINRSAEGNADSKFHLYDSFTWSERGLVKIKLRIPLDMF